MNYLETIKTVLSYIPALIAAIKAVEEAIPIAGQGAAKMAAVGEILAATDQLANGAGDYFAKIWPTLQSIGSSFVKLFNVTGVFANSVENKG